MSTSISARQMTKVHDTLEEKGLDGELLQSDLLGKGILADIAEAVVRGTVPAREELRKFLGLLGVFFQLIVDYTMSLSDMVSAGQYDWVNPEITEANFPKTRTGSISLNAELLHFNRTISSENALKEMEKLGFRPATIEELLAFGAKYPELQRQFPIVALGSSCVLGGDRRVPCLDEVGSGRDLDLYWFEDVWYGRYRFLVVRN